MMTPFTAMILWVLFALFVTGLIISRWKTYTGKERLIYIILLFTTFTITSLLYSEYRKPHHGSKPTMKDVETGTAHIDTVRYVDDTDTLSEHEFVWDE